MFEQVRVRLGLLAGWWRVLGCYVGPAACASEQGSMVSLRRSHHSLFETINSRHDEWMLEEIRRTVRRVSVMSSSDHSKLLSTVSSLNVSLWVRRKESSPAGHSDVDYEMRDWLVGNTSTEAAG